MFASRVVHVNRNVRLNASPKVIQSLLLTKISASTAEPARKFVRQTRSSKYNAIEKGYDNPFLLYINAIIGVFLLTQTLLSITQNQICQDFVLDVIDYMTWESLGIDYPNEILIGSVPMFYDVHFLYFLKPF